VNRDRPWLAHPARISSIHAETADVSTYELRLDDPAVASAYRFRPGQFNMVYLPGIGESAISISSDPDDLSRLSHTIRVVGNVTSALARRKVGDPVLLRGPFGSCWPVEECRGCDVVLAAGGLGLAPLRPVVHYIVNHRDQFGAVWMLYGARTPASLLFTDQYDSWRAAGIETNVTVDFGDESWDGQIGVVPQLLDASRLAVERTRVLTCGPEIMMRFVIQEALLRGVSGADIFLSMERNMNCALGFCGHCQLGPAFVCKDGPVFRYEQLEPYLHVEDF
jgi:NAD(P)H-flavin reductase